MLNQLNAGRTLERENEDRNNHETHEMKTLRNAFASFPFLIRVVRVIRGSLPLQLNHAQSIECGPHLGARK